jgi:hypothetical protein
MPDMGTGVVPAASLRGADRRDKREHLLADVRERGVRAGGIGRGPVMAAANPQVTQRAELVNAKPRPVHDFSISKLAGQRAARKDQGQIGAGTKSIVCFSE